SPLFHAILWNSSSALVLALLVFGVSRIPVIHRRPALLHLLWFGVLMRLVGPSLGSIPILPGLPGPVPVESEIPDVLPQNISVSIVPREPVEAFPSPEPVAVAPTAPPVAQWDVSSLLIAASLTGTALLFLLCLYRVGRIGRLLREAQDPPARLLPLAEQS